MEVVIIKNIYDEILIDNSEIRLESHQNTYTADEAIKAGTIFKTLDIPYKGYKITNFNGLSKKDSDMLDIQKYCLLVHDLGLYLDVYPNDHEAVSLRKKYSEILKNEIRKYESMYTPFSKSNENLNRTPYPWSTTVFPWGDE